MNVVWHSANLESYKAVQSRYAADVRPKSGLQFVADERPSFFRGEHTMK